ncbi:RING finger protein B [Neolecta irregularis DAH-3]|uniref:RING finger protein B n=1 Tax=Neolecta irregularis (strain DAH-3) TaxID=1198029 RepID=A0A1U7LK06_NEOID|nr:RING finger protein B [Neolecta irregularis DAH-3]|eukprot:OLL22996.1 RING finger protein B [Neolecta irregularis DAH-3]
MALSLYALYSLPDLPVPAVHAFPTTPLCACSEPEKIVYSNQVRAWVLVCPNKTIGDLEKGCRKRILYGNYRPYTTAKWLYHQNWNRTDTPNTNLTEKNDLVPAAFAQTRPNDMAVFPPYIRHQGLEIPMPPPRSMLLSQLHSLTSQRAIIKAERIETRLELEKSLNVARENYAGDGKCMTCLLHDRNALCLPCKHLNQCIICAPKLKKCPVCRRHVEKLMRVYDVDK